MPNTMAAFPAASNKTVIGADVLTAEKTSWRDRVSRLLHADLPSLGIRALPVLSKSLHERFDKLDPALRPVVIRVWVIMATILVLALAVPPLLLVYFIGQHMAQMWALAASLCFYVFFLLFLCVRRNWRCHADGYADFFSLSYGFLLLYIAAGVTGPPHAAVFVLHLTTAWAAGYLGYYVAVHGLPKGTERAIDALTPQMPLPSYRRNDTAEKLAHWISIGGFMAVLSTALMAAILYGPSMTKALDIIFALWYMGWIHGALFAAYVAGGLLHEPLLLNAVAPDPLPSLLVSCVIASPFIGLLSAVLSVLFQSLFLMALVAFLGYNLAVYMDYLHTAAAPRRIKRP